MGKQRKMDHEDGPYGGQFGGGGPEIPSEGWSQDPGWSEGPGYSYEFPPHMGKVDFTGQGEARSESGLTLTNITGYPDGHGRTHHTATDQDGRVWHWSYEYPAESDAEKDWDISYRDTDGQLHQYYTKDDGTWAEDHALEDENLAQDHLNPFTPDGQEENLGQDHLPPPSPYDGIEDENLAKDHLPLPDTGIQGEENHTEGRLPLPDDTPIQAKDNLAKGHLPGLVDEEPPAEQSPPAEPPVQPNPPPPADHGLQENLAKDYGFPGLDVEPAPSVIGNQAREKRIPRLPCQIQNTRRKKGRVPKRNWGHKTRPHRPPKTWESKSTMPKTSTFRTCSKSPRPPCPNVSPCAPSTRSYSTRARRGRPSIMVWSSRSSRARSWLTPSTITRT